MEVSDRISRSRSDISAYSANPFTKKRIPLDHPIRVTALGRTPYFEVINDEMKGILMYLWLNRSKKRCLSLEWWRAATVLWFWWQSSCSGARKRCLPWVNYPKQMSSDLLLPIQTRSRMPSNLQEKTLLIHQSNNKLVEPSDKYLQMKYFEIESYILWLSHKFELIMYVEEAARGITIKATQSTL